MNRTTRTRLAALTMLGALTVGAVTACGDDDGDVADSPSTTETDSADTTTTTTTETTTTAAAEPATDHGRVVALAEEFLLADLLSLGITPVASSATVVEAGFQGVDPAAVEGIEVLSMTDLNLEQVAALEPDTIVTLQFWVDRVGENFFAGLGNLVIVPDNLTGEAQLTELGRLLDREAEAAALRAELEAARVAADEAIADDCVVSLATIYAGPNVAAYVSAEWPLPTAVVEAGCTLEPGTDEADPDANGRAWLSLEQLGLLDAPRMVLFQTSAVEGEDAAVASIQEQPLWQTLPSVTSDDVVVFDRLGYPGAEGQIRFLDELAAALG